MSDQTVTETNAGSPENPSRRTLRINFVFPRVDLSGGLKCARLLAEAMVRCGHDVCMAYVDLPYPWPKLWRPDTWLRRLRDEWAMRSKPRHHLHSDTVRMIPVKRPCVMADDVPDADVTIATWWETMRWIWDWPTSKGIKAHYVQHDESELNSRRRAEVDEVLRLPSLKLPTARWLERLMVERYGMVDALLVPYGVDRTQFVYRPRRRPDVPAVGFMYGRQPLKGASIAFEAVRLARQQLPQLRLLAFGASRPDPLPEGLEFELAPSPQRIAEMSASVSCWLMPSVLEGFGMPGLEAAACGTPVIATRSGGPEDYVEDGVNGYLVPVNDAAAMAQRIVETCTLPPERWEAMSRASYEISLRFDWDKSAEILERRLVEAVGSNLHQQQGN